MKNKRENKNEPSPTFVILTWISKQEESVVRTVQKL